jgi:acyl-CoA thioesterase YciA
MTAAPLPPPGHELTLRVTPMPADVNSNGDIFGGWVMAQVDIAGGIAAARRARGRVVTVAVNAFQFKQPVSVGDVLSFFTRVETVGRTSITVHVEVIAARNATDSGRLACSMASLHHVTRTSTVKPICVVLQERTLRFPRGFRHRGRRHSITAIAPFVCPNPPPGSTGRSWMPASPLSVFRTPTIRDSSPPFRQRRSEAPIRSAVAAPCADRSRPGRFHAEVLYGQADRGTAVGG